MQKSSCPIPNSHRRLLESFIIFEDLIQNYNDEVRFTLLLNNLIQSLRNVTFLLQKELAHTSGFEEWYLLEQQKMRQDGKMKWLHDSRNMVVKEADLSKESFARVSLKDHRDHIIVEAKASPRFDSRRLAKILLKDIDIKVPEDLHSRLIIEIEKYWIVDNYRTSEVGMVLIYCLDYIKNLLNKAHRDFFNGSLEDCSDLDKNNFSKNSRLVLENIFKSSRIVHINYKTGKVFKKEIIQIDSIPRNLVEKRYGSFQDLKKKQVLRGEDLPFNKVRFHKEMVRRLFNVDKCIVPVAFLYFPDSDPIICSFKFEDPAERYLVFEEVANKVKETGCKAVVWVSEAWSGKMPRKGERYIPPTEQKERELIVIVAANPQETTSYFFEIVRRRFRKPVLNEDINVEQGRFIAFERIYKVWEEGDKN